MSKSLAKDVITEEMAEQSIQSHLKEEQVLEKKLGSKFLTKIDPEEAGSTLEAVNRKNSESAMMQEFFREVEQDYSSSVKEN